MMLALLALLGGTARAGVDEELQRMEVGVAGLEERATTLESRAGAGLFFSTSEAVKRYEDAVYQHLLGNFEDSAVAFHALVSTEALTDPELRAECEVYLAEAMHGLGNRQMAAARYREIAEQPNHPFRTQAVVELLRLYSELGELDRFRALYDQEIVPGRVRTTPEITYALAKSFWIQDDHAPARSYFEQVPPDTEWYVRARYFLGVVDVADGKLAEAKARFDEVVALPVANGTDQEVHDLALLALGRLAYAAQDYTAAYAAYGTIASDSPVLDQRLYELVWTSIRTEDWHDALNNVEIFLLGFPDHEYTGQFKVLQGHLASREERWDEALASYESVISEYDPLRRRFEDLSRAGVENEQMLDEFLRAPQLAGMPDFAVAMVRADPELGRALRLFGEIESQERDLGASDRMIGELRALFDSSVARATFDRLVLDAWAGRSEALGLRLELLHAEGRWAGTERVAAIREAPLGPEARWRAVDDRLLAAVRELETFQQGVAAVRISLVEAEEDVLVAEQRLVELGASATAAATDSERQAAAVERDRVSLERSDALARMADANARIAAMSLPDLLSSIQMDELAAVETEVSTLARALAAARSPTRASSPIAASFDELHRRFGEAGARLGAAGDTLRARETADLDRLRSQFDAEVANVASERASHDSLSAEAHRVSIDAARLGFQRIALWFGDSVRKADIGIVDVFWAEKLETVDEITAVRTEEGAAMSELDRAFSLLRDQLGGDE